MSNREPADDGWAKLTAAALVLAVGLVLARGMILEVLRGPGVSPGQEIVVRSAGPAVTVTLDLLSYLPAILVALRAIFDEHFRLRRSATAVLLALIGVWALASVFWSGDRFAAGVSAGKLLSGSAILWAMVQSVRGWRDFRLVASALAGLLALNVVHGLVYIYYDAPQMRQMWEATRETQLQQMGIEPGSFAAQQWEKRVGAGELLGYCASPNSLAALTVMITVLVMGYVAGQRRLAAAGLGLSLIAGAVWMILKTQSMTAYATPALGLALLAAGWYSRGFLARHRSRAFAAGVGLFFGVCAAVIGHGIYHGTLFHKSLTYRWHYWTASWQMFRDHLLSGVGWENFGESYLRYRLPISPEEIRDPHNFFVRFATELGVAGLLLALGWVAALAWEMTRPAKAIEVDERDGSARPLVWACAIGVVVAMIAGVDWNVEWSLEVLTRGMYALVLVAVALLFASGDFRRIGVAGESSPLLVLGAVAGVAMFVVHSQIDFAAFETGPFYLLVLLAGAVTGLRYSLAGEEGKAGGKLAALWWIGAMAGTGVLVAAPVLTAESRAAAGERAVASTQFAEASRDFAKAYEDSAWLRNAEYLVAQSRAMLWGGARPEQVMPILHQAAKANPLNVGVWLMIGEASARAGAWEEARRGFEKAIELNPADVGVRLRAGGALIRGRGQERWAADQFEQALRLNELLAPEEPERLSAERIEQVKRQIEAAKRN